MRRVLATGAVQKLTYNRRALPETDNNPDSDLAAATRYFRRGRFARARETCEAILARQPSHAGALQLLAVVAGRTGEWQNAIGLLERGLANQPGDPKLYYNVGNLYQAGGQLEAAVRAYRKAIELDPQFLEAYNNLGIALQSTGNEEDAAQSFESALMIDAGHTGARSNLATLRYRQGRLDEATNLYEQLIQAQPSNAAAYNSLGKLRHDQNRLDDAVKAYEHAIELEPDLAPAWNNLGIVLQQQDRLDAAVAAYERALSIAPDYALAYANLAVLYEKTNRLEIAVEVASRGLHHAPDDPFLSIVAAKCERRSGRVEDGIVRLAQRLPETVENKWRQAMHYELGRLYDRGEDAPAAFEHFTAANRLAAEDWSSQDRGRNPYREFFDVMQPLFTAEWVEQWTPLSPASAEPAPVFLVGFPRSGTTLLDQILDAHPNIQVLEEEPLIDTVQDAMGATPEVYLEKLACLTEEELAELRTLYLKTAEQYLRPGAGAVMIDKLPLNSVMAVLIHRIFPEARFIFAARHPYDVILSCFMQEFGLNHAMAHFFSLEDTVGFYHEVLDLWLRYEALLPLKTHYVHYERVVDDLESEARGLLDFVGVEWDDAVLRYDAHARSRGKINTPSYHQVSQPIYRHARFRWPRYAEFLAPLHETLRPYIEHFGYTDEPS